MSAISFRSIAVLALAVAGPARAQAPASGAAPASEEVAVFAGGCYWTIEAVFEHLKGVREVVSGFAVPVPAPGVMSQLRRTTSAEAVRVVYDPSRISYRQLLEVFFKAAHDPTEIDRQGPDVGPQYRSVVFVRNDAERDAARTLIDELEQRGVFPRPVATEIAAARSFSPAADQDFVARNPRHPYVLVHDVPKLAALRRLFPALVRE